MHENTFSTFHNIFHTQKYVLLAKKKVLQIFQFHEVDVLYQIFHFHNSCMKIKLQFIQKASTTRFHDLPFLKLENKGFQAMPFTNSGNFF